MKTIFISDDGKKFDIEAECLGHERRVKINTMVAQRQLETGRVYTSFGDCVEDNYAGIRKIMDSGVQSEVDWHSVERGTKILVCDHLDAENWFVRFFARYRPDAELKFQASSTSDSISVCGWKYAKLFE